MFVHNILLAGCVTALALAGAARADEARVVGVRAMFNGDGKTLFKVELPG